MKLNDKRTPTCPNCKGAKLYPIEYLGDAMFMTEKGDIAQNVSLQGFCLECRHTFVYTQTYLLVPESYKDLEDITDLEELEDEEYDFG